MINSTASYFVGVKGGLVMSVIAFSIVFIVIIGLVLLLMAMEHISNGIDKMSGNGVTDSSQLEKKNSSVALAVRTETDNKELIAVITAAITAMCGKAVKILSFAPISAPKASGWRMMHKANNTEDFLN